MLVQTRRACGGSFRLSPNARRRAFCGYISRWPIRSVLRVWELPQRTGHDLKSDLAYWALCRGAVKTCDQIGYDIDEPIPFVITRKGLELLRGYEVTRLLRFRRPRFWRN